MIDVITELLEKRLAALASELNLPVAYENVRFEDVDSTYLRAFTMPANTDSFDLEGETRVYQGIFQVNIVATAEIGKSASQSIAKAIAERFDYNTEMIEGDFTLYINSVPRIYTAITDETTYTIPVSMNYRADYLII